MKDLRKIIDGGGRDTMFSAKTCLFKKEHLRYLTVKMGACARQGDVDLREKKGRRTGK